MSQDDGAPKGGLTGTGKTATGARLADKEKAAQSQALMVRRIMESATHKQLALMFGTSPVTVAKRLEEARAGQLQELTRELITERLIPLAVGVLEAQLQAGNYEAAKDVLYGLQVLQKGGKATIEHVTSSTPTLDQIRKERAKAVEGLVITSDAPSKASGD